jgi:hypothetical protein
MLPALLMHPLSEGTFVDVDGDVDVDDVDAEVVSDELINFILPSVSANTGLCFVR